MGTYQYNSYSTSSDQIGLTRSHPNIANPFCFDSNNELVTHRNGVGPSNFKSFCMPSVSTVRPVFSTEKEMKSSREKSKKKAKRGFLEYIRHKINKVFLNNKNEMSNFQTNRCKSFSNSFLDNISNSFSEDSFADSNYTNIPSQPFQSYSQSPANQIDNERFPQQTSRSFQKDREWKDKKVDKGDRKESKGSLKIILQPGDGPVGEDTLLVVRSDDESSPESCIRSVALKEPAVIESTVQPHLSTNVQNLPTNNGSEAVSVPPLPPKPVNKTVASSSSSNNTSPTQKPPFAGVEKSLACELKEIARHGWYWGPITRTEAEEKLIDQPDGSFLLRDSSDTRHLLSLSFKSFGKTLHTRIEHSNGWYSFYPQPDHDGHRSLVELIDHCIKESDTGVFCYSKPLLKGSPAFPVRLTKPVSRFTQVRSLQYLCRFVIRQYTSINHIQTLPLPSKIKGYLQQSYF